MKSSRVLALTAVLLSLVSFPLPTTLAAGNDYTEGLSLYNQKNYRAAAQKFEAAMRAKPGDGNIVYYCALANQLSNNHARARQLYQYITTTFPNSRYSSLANDALKSLGGYIAVVSAAPTGSAPGDGTGSGSNAPPSDDVRRPTVSISGPSEFRVPFTRGRSAGSGSTGGVYIEVQVNGRPITFHLDTGAFSTLMGANQLDALGLARPAAGHKFSTGGVGERGVMPAWQQKVDLKLGSIYARDFPVTVQEIYEGEPLLGQDFLREWETTVDTNSNQVSFKRRGTGSTMSKTRGAMDVPFTIEGQHMIVTVEVNGKPYPFYFDTGADSIALSMRDVKALGLESQLAGSSERMHQGVGGSTVGHHFNVDRMKVGPIVKENMEVAALEQTTMRHPLLGQSFFGEYSYTIDEANKLIHFRPGN